MLKTIKQKIAHHFSSCWRKYLWTMVIVVVFCLGISIERLYPEQNQANILEIKKQENQYMAFLSEVYNKIQENYWEKLTDKELSALFGASIEKLGGKINSQEIKNKQDLEKVLENTFKKVNLDKKKEFTTQLANIVLVNLKTKSRSRLYTKKDEQQLINRVENINPETNLYEILGLNKQASKEEIAQAYKDKAPQLEDEALEEVEYAHQVLSDNNQKQRYDKTGAEPTVLASLIRPEILYLYINKVSPTALTELEQQIQKFNNIPNLDSLILDLRANVGGSIDILSYLLGPFIGKDQYAYEFFHQNEKTPYKTKVGWLSDLVQYKKVVILIDDKTQSSAEVMASVFKKYNVGILVGTTTQGWGTIEAVENLDQKLEEQEYSIFLVHSLTLRTDGQPIEGNGVEPTININQSDWKEKLYSYFHYSELINVIEEIWNNSPGQI